MVILLMIGAAPMVVVSVEPHHHWLNLISDITPSYGVGSPTNT